MRVTIAQTDCRLGLVEDNLDQARSHVEEAHARGADLVVLPELALHGYALGRLDHDASLESIVDPFGQVGAGAPWSSAISIRARYVGCGSASRCCRSHASVCSPMNRNG